MLMAWPYLSHKDIMQLKNTLDSFQIYLSFCTLHPILDQMGNTNIFYDDYTSYHYKPTDT